MLNLEDNDALNFIEIESTLASLASKINELRNWVSPSKSSVPTAYDLAFQFIERLSFIDNYSGREVVVEVTPGSVRIVTPYEYIGVTVREIERKGDGYVAITIQEMSGLIRKLEGYNKFQASRWEQAQRDAANSIRRRL